MITLYDAMLLRRAKKSSDFLSISNLYLCALKADEFLAMKYV